MKILKILSRNEGYTFIEVFISLILIGLISTIIATNYGIITNRLNRGRDNLIISYEQLCLKLIVSNECQKIKPPWFLRRYEVIRTGGSIEVFYYNGIKEDSLKISFLEGDGITVSGGGVSVYHSENLEGSFEFSGTEIIYTEGDILLRFPFGVFLA